MEARTVLAEQIRLLYDTLAQNVEGMSEAHSLVQPQGGGNCANWILGHLTAVQNHFAALLEAEPVWEDPSLERAGRTPITEPHQAIPWDTMVTRFLDSGERILQALAKLPERRLADPVPDPFGGTTPRIGLLTVLAFHQVYHAGQLALSRRMAGLPGAIQIPG
jgi:uncharacterized damage-inducible protein DinB